MIKQDISSFIMLLKKPLYSEKNILKTDYFSSLSDFEKKILKDLKFNGYSIIKNFFNEKIIENVINDCNGKYLKNKEYANENNRIPDAFHFSENVRQIAVDNRIIDLLSKLYGLEAFPFQTLNFNIGTQQPLHSDMVHFSSFPKYFMAGVWVAFEDVNNNNGPLEYVENSHFLPDIIPNDIPGFYVDKESIYKEYKLYEEYIKDLVKNLALEKKYALMNKGDILIWTSNLIHGGSKIKDSSLTRYSQVTHYFFKDCIHYTPLLSNPYKGEYEWRHPFDIAKQKNTPIEHFNNIYKKIISK